MNPKSDSRSGKFPKPNRGDGNRSQPSRNSSSRSPYSRSSGEKRDFRSKRDKFKFSDGNSIEQFNQEGGKPRRSSKESEAGIASSSRSSRLRNSFGRSTYNRRAEKNGQFQGDSRNFEKKRRQNDKYKFRPPNFDKREDMERLSETEYQNQSPSEDLIWGRHSSQSALESGRPIHRIWCTQELRSSQKFLQLLRDAKASGVLVEEVTWARLGQLTNGAVHQGIVIQIAEAETIDLNTLIDGCKGIKGNPLLIALDGLTDPQNLGAIIRSAEALGAHGIILPQRRSAGLTGSVAKVAVGALEHLPIARVVNMNRSLAQLQEAGYSIIGLAEEGDSTLSEVPLEGPIVLVIGSEAKGISLVTRRYCDHLVRIPLRGVTTSLNASVAAAICIYEIARNSWMKGLSGQAPSPRMVKANFASSLLDQDNFPKSKDVQKPLDSFILDSMTRETNSKANKQLDNHHFDESIDL